ncbi:DUF3168 domain-containing protein [Rhodobaculum claviforme]|uniref:DUF3168 domain-containing protein n=1 Tax=Rhodobaculum claviforme TaxID=1549854 RepID=A0A934TMD0_9RHOB|nr:DUF3168 domain-containing protein [Rhodobaculum claviforme]MBK5928522.1 hypothetical protein [Rhodobaculum claviforme]
MSYATAAALQAAVYARLASDPVVTQQVGGAIHDAVPAGTPPGTFVVVGQGETVDRSCVTTPAAEHRLRISVISNAAGFQRAKEAAAAVSDAMLADPVPVLPRGRVVGVWFARAEAGRVRGTGARRIELTFRVLVED